jgi:hypothetical protein
MPRPEDRSARAARNISTDLDGDNIRRTLRCADLVYQLTDYSVIAFYFAMGSSWTIHAVAGWAKRI